MPKSWCWLALLLVGLLALAGPTWAQSEASAVLSEIDTSSFPRNRLYLDVREAPSRFMHGLQAGDINISEDGQLLPVVELEPIRPGVQAVIAVNPGESFTIRDIQGVSRYDLLRDALTSWLQSRRGSSVDTYSLVVAGGPERTHTNDPEEPILDLEAYELDPGALSPSLEILARAVEIAADSTPREGMGRAVLLITAPMGGDLSSGLQTLLSRTKEQNIPVHVWLVSSPDLVSTPASNQLREFAIETGGEFFTFSGTEAIPDPEHYLEHLRNKYRASYDSRITGAGVHTLAVEIGVGETRIESPVREFDVELSPPQPIFISPDPEITRAVLPEDRSGVTQEIDPSDLFPRQQQLHVLIDFPDGKPRPLQYTALYIDGSLIEQHTQPPFDLFTWDLTPYTTTTQHILQVEAVDQLGLTGRSIETLVNVVVERPQLNPFISVIQRWPALVGLAVLLAGSVVILVLVITGRIHPPKWGQSLSIGRGRRRAGAPQGGVTGGETQGSLEESPGINLTGWVNRLSWPQRRLAPRAYAYLSPLTETGENVSAEPVPVSSEELTLGQDASQATLVLTDPSVDALHARLVRTHEGAIRIKDERSVAGTWVNYSPVSSEGRILKEGDLVHVGRVGFRFTQRDTKHVRKPVVVFQESRS